LTFKDTQSFEVDPQTVELQDDQDGLRRYPRGILLQELAVDVVDGYRHLGRGYLAERNAAPEDDLIGDDTLYQVAHLLAEAGEALPGEWR
jgi:hypothetical protein